MEKEEKINLLIKNFDCIKTLPGVEKEELNQWNKEDLEKLLNELNEVKEKLHKVANICIEGNCNALENLGIDSPLIDIFRMLNI